MNLYTDCKVTILTFFLCAELNSLDVGGGKTEVDFSSDAHQRQESTSVVDNQSEHMYDSSNLGVSCQVEIFCMYI